MTIEEPAVPNARKLLNQVLRGLDYSFESAIADIVDNSIQAEADLVEITIAPDASYVMISDNGVGMDDKTHLQSMVIASETRDYSNNDLGKFGTGMKSASLSMADKLTVITRTSNFASPTIRSLDLEHIAQTNDWNRLVLRSDLINLNEFLLNAIPRSSGTCVIWERLRLLDSNQAEISAKDVAPLIARTELYLRAAFHRFLDGEVPDKPKLRLKLNGFSVIGWNPFVPGESTVRIAPNKVLQLKDGSRLEVTGYVIPAQSEYSTPDAFAEAKGSKSFNDGQGFYCYRNNRLIKSGGWLGMMSPDPHTSLARISLDFNSELDSVLSVNVNKSKVQLPPKLRQEIGALVSATAGQARKRYSAKRRAEGLGLNALIPRSNLSADNIPARRHTAIQLAEVLDEVAAQKGLIAELNNLKAAVRDQSLTIAQELGW